MKKNSSNDMKRFLIILALTLMVSCASTQHVVRTDIVEIDEVAYVLENYYPELFYYYMEGVLQVKSIRENVLADGTVDYDINYEFVRYYYRTYREQMDVLKEYYPELYRRYWNGTIHINSIYKYVDRQSGTIEYSVSYSNHYDSHYGYPYVVIRRGRDPLFPPPSRPEPRGPKVRPRPEPRPKNDPGMRPVNPPRPEPGNRPNNQPRVQQNNQPRTQQQATPRSNGNTSTRSTQSNGGNRQGQGGGGRR